MGEGPASSQPRPWRSVRVRITAVSVIVFGLAFGAAAFAVVRSVRHALTDQLAADLSGAGATITRRVAAGEPVGDVIGAGAGGMFACLNVPETLPPGSDAVPVPRCPDALRMGAGDEGGAALRQRMMIVGAGARGVEGGEALVESVEVDTPSGPVTIQLVGPLASVQRSVDVLNRALVIGTPALIAAVGAMVWWLVGRALRPVEQLRAEVDAISHSTLDRRLKLPGSHDEIERLARTMNDMLDRLDSSAAEQRRFVSDASHELRTPLAVIRTSLDVARRHPAELPPADALERIDRAAARSEALVAELLELARIEESAGRRRHETVDVDGVVTEAVADALGGRDDVGVRLAGGPVIGDAPQLRRLVVNLVRNARTHGGERAVVATTVEGGSVVLTVDDDGPGIPPADREIVFRRFARLEGSRSRPADAGGWGLGLPIAAAVARLHGGSITITDAPLGGARVIVRLPAV